MDSVRNQAHVVPVMIQRLETDAIRDEKDNRLLMHQKRRHGLLERYPQKVQAAEEKAGTRGKILCRYFVPIFPYGKVYESVM